MTRMAVAVEGKPFADGKMIEHGAIQLEDDRIPVNISADWTYIVGWATDIQREDGLVTMEITLLSEYAGKADLKDFDAFVYLAPIESKSDFSKNLRLIVTRGRLRGVSIQLKG